MLVVSSVAIKAGWHFTVSRVRRAGWFQRRELGELLVPVLQVRRAGRCQCRRSARADICALRRVVC